MVTESKRYHPTKFTRIVIYPLGFLLFFIALSVILVMANGYNFHFNDGKVQIVKTGMIIANTRPSEAQIFLDGKKYAKKTTFSFLPVKISNLTPGKYTLKFTKEGYRTWENMVEVKANLVSWANYILLFPNELNIKEVDNLKNKQIITSSKNKRYLLVSGQEEGISTLFAYDQNNGNLNKIWPKSFVPTEEWLKSPVIESAEFNQNSDKLLLKVKNGETFTYAVLETANDGKIYPIFSNVSLSKVTWSSSDPNELYVLSADKLKLVRISKPADLVEIATNVVDFSSEKNRKVYYVTQIDKQSSLHQMDSDGNRKEVIEDSVKSDTAYKFGYSSQQDALGFLPVNDKTLTIYFKINGKITNLQLSKDITNFKWSLDGRTIMYHNGLFIKNYDFLEEKEITAVLSDKIVSADWYFDDKHYLVQTEKELFVVDFDNTNKVVFSDKPIAVFYQEPKLSNFIYVDKSNGSTLNKIFNSSF